MKNILLITVDELRADCTGFSGNPDARTPHLDALAARGVVLNNHFAPFPKCVPSRCAMLTGRYCHTDGLRSVRPENHLPPTAPTVPAVLRSAGWETAYLGLNHVWTDDGLYGPGELRNRHGAGVTDYTSFTEGTLGDLALREIIHPPGQVRGGPGMEALRLAGLDFPGLRAGSLRDFYDANRANQAVAYLREVRDRSRPFFLQLNLSNPHPPYAAPEPWYSMFQPERLLRPFDSRMPAGAPLPLTAQRRWRTGDHFPAEGALEIQAVYLAMTAYVDSLIGQVLDALRAEDLERDTLVVFTSDHGDYAGEFGLLEKWDSDLRDALLRVPFIVAHPDLPRGAVREGLSEHVDLPSTLLEWAGLDFPEHWNVHGRSLWPLMHGGAGKKAVFADGGHEEPLRRRFQAEVYGRNGMKSTDGKQLVYRECPDAMAKSKMVRTNEWKLVVRETGGNELYHLPTDPSERLNLWNSPDHREVLIALQSALLDWTLRTDPDQPYLNAASA